MAPVHSLVEKADELQDPEYSKRETAAVRHQEQVMSASWDEEGTIGVIGNCSPTKARGLALHAESQPCALALVVTTVQVKCPSSLWAR